MVDVLMELNVFVTWRAIATVTTTVLNSTRATVAVTVLKSIRGSYHCACTIDGGDTKKNWSLWELPYCKLSITNNSSLTFWQMFAWTFLRESVTYDTDDTVDIFILYIF